MVELKSVREVKEKAERKNISIYPTTRRILEEMCEIQKMSASELIESLIYKYKIEASNDKK